MTFTLDTKALAAALKPMVKALDKRSTIPVLQGIHVRSGEGRVRFTATDLELAIVQTMEHNTDGLRIAKLLHALEDHINGAIGEGPLTDETRAFKIRIIERMKAQGWRVSRGASDRWQVLPPQEGR